MRKLTFSEEILDQACKMFASGSTQGAIAEATGMPWKHQNQLYKDRNITQTKEQQAANKRNKVQSKYLDRKDEAVKLRQQGIAPSKIAKALGLTINVVRGLTEEVIVTPEQKKYMLASFTPEQEALVVQLKKAYTHLDDIVSQTGLDKYVIMYINRRNGLNMGTAGRSKTRQKASKYTWEILRERLMGLNLNVPMAEGLVGPINIPNKKTNIEVVCFCEKPFTSSLYDIMGGKVTSCGGHKSVIELELQEFVRTLCPNSTNNNWDIIEDNGHALELDVYVPDVFGKPVAVEMNGIYHHSSKFRGEDKYADRDKYLLCKAKGIRLITIYEDEWKLRNAAVKGFLEAILTKKSRVGARECEVRTIPYLEAQAFLEQHHIQGSVTGTAYGMFYGGNLIGCSVFRRKPKKEKIWELSRYCVAGYGIDGGLSKVLAQFIKDHRPDKIVTFSDNRWSEGQMYAKAGFAVDKTIPPIYCYVRNGTGGRIRKEYFRKDKIKDSPEWAHVYDSAKTEEVMAAELGYYQLFDLGKVRWVLKVA